jgi:1-acyl-sn-glycerol-3-phosphate acyltransferase
MHSMIGRMLMAGIGQAVRDAISSRLAPDDNLGPDPAVIDWAAPFVEFLYHHYFRVETVGEEALPTSGPALLIGNHSGGFAAYDAAMIATSVFNRTHRYVRFLVDDFLVDLPLLGNFFRRTGATRATYENASQLLADGQVIIDFPEGVQGIGKTYDQRYKLQRFGQGGFIRLAIRSGAPIIPVAVIGAEEIHPIVWKSYRMARPLGVPYLPFTPTLPWLGPLGLVPLPTKWKIRFGTPIDFSNYRKADADNDELVHELAQGIKTIIQQMIDEMLAERKSLWV